jgi:hypothetical protein
MKWKILYFESDNTVAPINMKALEKSGRINVEGEKVNVKFQETWHSGKIVGEAGKFSMTNMQFINIYFATIYCLFREQKRSKC